MKPFASRYAKLTPMSFEDTIAAISTAPGVGAIAIVRLSGKDSWSIAKKIFRPFPPGGENDPPLTSHTAKHGYLTDPQSGSTIDEVVVIPYKGPNSYTGEDLVEIDCHGNPLVTREILNLCLSLGARLARPGEFTQRAFLSGKIDLTQAESVLDLIQAKTTRQKALAMSALAGRLGDQIKAIRQEALDLLTEIVAGIDFPDEVGDCAEEKIATTVDSCLAKLDRLLKTYRSGRFLREGMRVAIVGKPNAGKSSLLNQLLNFERAIVTEIPGTTRDSLEEPLDINGIPVVLIDTAGIRHTTDEVERIGIERSRQAVRESDLVLMLFEANAGYGKEDETIAELLGGKPAILLANKIDLNPRFDFASLYMNGTDLEEPGKAFIERLPISAQSGSGVDAIASAIEKFVLADDSLRDAGGSLNTRQNELCLKAAQSLQLVKQTLESHLPQDCLATDLKLAVDQLSEVCGESVTEEVITRVFQNFCIGK